MSKALFKMEVKANYKLFLLFAGILTLYVSVISAMYDPKLEMCIRDSTLYFAYLYGDYIPNWNVCLSYHHT